MREEIQRAREWEREREQNNNNCINLPAGVRAAQSASLMGVIIEGDRER